MVMLQGLVAGTTDTATLADLAKGKLRDKRTTLERALRGRMGAHQRFLLSEQLCHIDSLEDAIERVSAEIAERVQPFDSDIARLDAIPGVGRRTAEALVAEIGTDMTRFPTAAHLASWAGMCPGNHESAGKQQSGRTRPGNKWLKATLVEASQAIARTRGTYLATQFRRLAARRGKHKAAVAVGHSLLFIAYHLLAHDRDYADLGPTYFEERDRQLVQRRLVRRLEDLGYRVAIEPLLPVTAPA